MIAHHLIPKSPDARVVAALPGQLAEADLGQASTSSLENKLLIGATCRTTLTTDELVRAKQDCAPHNEDRKKISPCHCLFLSLPGQFPRNLSCWSEKQTVYRRAMDEPGSYLH